MGRNHGGDWRDSHAVSRRETWGCPKCGGDDRWRGFEDFAETGGAICNQCGKGKNGGGMADGFSVLEWFHGWSFPETLRKVADYLQLDADHKPHKRPQNSPKEAPKKNTSSVFSKASEAVKRQEDKLGPRSTCWTYRNASGEPVGLVVRWDTAEGKEIRPVSRRSDGWRIEAMEAPRPLYRLPEILETDGPVYVCEGEKTVEAAVSIGLIATTSSGGSSAPRKTDWSPLAGREVVVFPDNDKAGCKYAETVAGILTALEPSATVKVVELPELPSKGDMAD